MHLSTQIVARRQEGQVTYYRPLVAGGTRSRTQLYCTDSRVTWRESFQEDEGWAAVTVCYSEVGGEVFSIQQSGAFYNGVQPMVEPECDIPFQEKVSRADPFFHRLIGPLQILTEGTMEAIKAYIRDGTLLTCSDGSFESETGMASHAWVFSDKHGHLLWGGAGPIDGNPDMGSSYRSELGGALTVLFLLQQIVDYYEITSGSVMFYCDNQSALDNIFDEYPKRGIYPLLAPDYDLLGVARKIWRQLPIKVNIQHVKGHYKGDHRETKHDLNDLADTLAGHFLESPPAGYRPRRVPLQHPEYDAVLYHSGTAVTTKFREIIYSQIFTGDIRENIKKKTGWTNAQMVSIAWAAFDAAFRGKSLFQQISIAKLAHDLWHTGAQKKLFGIEEIGHCPICDSTIETMDHVFQCRHSSSIELKQKLLEEFHETLNILGTPSLIRQSIYTGLSWWMLEGGEQPCPRAPGFGKIYPAEVWATSAYSAQTSVGWGQMLRGRLSNSWGEAYVRETKSGKPKESHELWTKRVIGHLWKIAFSIWEHRNGVLHGHTKEQTHEIKQQELHTNVITQYERYRVNPSCIHYSARYLFDQPLERMLTKSRQYLLSWLRSVAVAVGHQEREAELLRRQAARFFDQPVRRERMERTASPTTISKLSNIRENDISSPSSYQLLERRQSRLSAVDEDADFSIPPAMFNEYLDSSYADSNQKDVPFRFDSSISSGEVNALSQEIDSINLSSSLSETEADSSYTGSNQSDVAFNRYEPFSFTELDQLGLKKGSSQTGSYSETSIFDAMSQQMSTLSITSSSSSRTKRRARAGQFVASLPSIPEDDHHLSRGDKEGATASTLDSSTAWHSRFPLWEIGGIHNPLHWQDSDISPLPNPTDSPEAQRASQLVVFGEFRSEGATLPFSLRQPSFSDYSNTSSAVSGAAISGRPVDHRLIWHLVNSAQRWLLSYTPDYQVALLSPSIYWAIRSLGFFYADNISQAERAGAPRMERVADDEWPDPPRGEDNYDWSLVPNWLLDLLNMEKLHDWGLRGVRVNRGCFTGGNIQRVYAIMDRYIQEIPQRELDDPPDWSDNSSGSDSVEVIEELSGETFEDNSGV